MRALPLLIPALLLCACRPAQVTPGPGEAVDCVCATNRDLACITVAKSPDTPHADYQGRTYYFCSEHCRAAFLKDPEKYKGACGKGEGQPAR